MSSKSGQKFIGGNRPPRVQIEYETETYGAIEKVNLPFVMGVMSDLAGDQNLGPVDQRKFLEVDMDNFTQRMQAISPKTAFRVENTLSGEGELGVNLEFNQMEDFSPDKIAEKVPELNTLLQARKRLSDLLAYADGKSGAENWLNDILQRPDFLAELADAHSSEFGGDNISDSDSASAKTEDPS